VIHRSSEARPPTGNPRRPEPHRRSRRRKGGSKPGPQGGGQGSAL
jgi:hypothetical protein